MYSIHAPDGTPGLFSSVPLIKRARGYRLYDIKGKRIIDMYQQNGHGILGHRPFSLTTVLKNTLSRGIIFDLPSIYTHRFKKAVKSTIPGIHTVLVTHSLEFGLDSLSTILGFKMTKADIQDPLTDPCTGPVAFWRPFLEDQPIQKWNPQVLIPILPFSAGGAPVTICFIEKSMQVDENSFPPVSPVLLSGAVRSLYDLKKYKKPSWCTGDLLKGIKKWKQRGIYIIPCMEKEEYQSIFSKFLDHGVLLSPYYPCPSIFPGELSEGELQKVLHLLRTP